VDPVETYGHLPHRPSRYDIQAMVESVGDLVGILELANSEKKLSCTRVSD
jgi:hypothetical protein